MGLASSVECLREVRNGCCGRCPWLLSVQGDPELAWTLAFSPTGIIHPSACDSVSAFNNGMTLGFVVCITWAIWRRLMTFSYLQRNRRSFIVHPHDGAEAS